MQEDILLNELVFKSVRSSGPGGQHANKVSSKVEVGFDIPNSRALSDNEKELLLSKLKSRLSNNGILILTSATTRSQHKNKILVINKLFDLLKNNLKVQPARKKTKVPQSSIEKRIKDKKNQALKKYNRKHPDL